MISIIVAVAENGVIGKANQMPWHLPADLTYFKETTLGHPIVMGRKTFESIGRPLPGRNNIVITRDREYASPGVQVIHEFDPLLLEKIVGEEKEIFIIGGANLYKQALPFAKRLYLTSIHAQFEGDTFFPSWNPSEWKLISCNRGIRNDENPYDHDFLVYERNTP